jgi:hypothetical protein
MGDWVTEGIVSQGVGVRKLYRLATPQCVNASSPRLALPQPLPYYSDTVCSFIFFRLQCSDSNHSANFFAPSLVLHAPQHLTMSISGGLVLLYRMNCSMPSSKRAVNASCNASWIIPGTRLGLRVAAFVSWIAWEPKGDSP